LQTSAKVPGRSEKTMRVNVSLALAGVLLLFAAPALAAGAPTWTVDKAHSKLGFDSAYTTIKFSGSFSDWSAQIAFDPKNLAASKAVVSVNLASAKTGDQDRDESLPSADWFNTAKFPRATFTTSAIKAIGPDRYQAAGVLNMKGVSKPVVLTFTLKINGAQAVMNGQAAIDRSQWGIGEGQFQDESTVPHAVTVDVNLIANRAG
jgi:polyisoprenoid-binding protein YceI